MRSQHFFLLVAAAAAAAGCGGSGQEPDRVTLADQGARPGGLPSAVQVPLDAGNAAYRAGDYAAALQHYRSASERAPDDVTPWIGISMAAGALENQALKDSATARIAVLAPDLAEGAGAAHGAPPASVHP